MTTVDKPRRGLKPTSVSKMIAVLRLMAEGRTNREIGRELGVSEDTVKCRARALFEDLGARDRAHAVSLGYQCGVLPKACDCEVSR